MKYFRFFVGNNTRIIGSYSEIIGQFCELLEWKYRYKFERNPPTFIRALASSLKMVWPGSSKLAISVFGGC